MDPPARHVRDRAFPPYAFVPGRHPHPSRDPRGHSFGEPPIALDQAFEWGVDLYNHGFYWEAHEAWEPLHRAAHDADEVALFAGLIQCAAACLKARDGLGGAAARLGRRALGHLGRARPDRAAERGLHLPSFVERSGAWVESGARRADTAPRILLEAPRPAA